MTCSLKHRPAGTLEAQIRDLNVWPEPDISVPLIPTEMCLLTPFIQFLIHHEGQNKTNKNRIKKHFEPSQLDPVEIDNFRHSSKHQKTSSCYLMNQ